MVDNLPLISVVVPVYKVEEYIDECISSLLNQTYQNLEIILVDDGSPDSCGKICDQYAEEYFGIKAFHKENGGLSDARNYGVERASGKFVAFVDSDDFVSSEYIAYLYQLMIKFNADISCCPSTKGYSPHSFSNVVKKETILSSEQALESMMYTGAFGCCAYAKLYPIELVRRFPFPKGKLYEDLAIMYKIIDSCNRIAFGDRDVYLYRIRQGAITHSIFTKAHLDGLRFAEEELQFIERNYPTIRKAAVFRVALKIIEYMPNLFFGTESDKEYFRFLRKRLIPIYMTVITDKKVAKGSKIRIISIIMGFRCCKMCYKALEKVTGRPF